MGYRVKTGRPIEHRGLQQLDAMRCGARCASAKAHLRSP